VPADTTMQANLGQAEALLRSGRTFLYEALSEAWHVVCAGQTVSLAQRAMLWLASTHTATAAKQATHSSYISAQPVDRAFAYAE
jgi:indole-3-acetate monooxygenase